MLHNLEWHFKKTNSYRRPRMETHNVWFSVGVNKGICFSERIFKPNVNPIRFICYVIEWNVQDNLLNTRHLHLFCRKENVCACMCAYERPCLQYPDSARWKTNKISKFMKSTVTLKPWNQPILPLEPISHKKFSECHYMQTLFSPHDQIRKMNKSASSEAYIFNKCNSRQFNSNTQKISELETNTLDRICKSHFSTLLAVELLESVITVCISKDPSYIWWAI